METLHFAFKKEHIVLFFVNTPKFLSLSQASDTQNYSQDSIVSQRF